MYLFNMKKDLLLKYYEIQCQMFIDGLIDYNYFEYLENQYKKRIIYYLFKLIC
jgi:hypothetical protein